MAIQISKEIESISPMGTPMSPSGGFELLAMDRKLPLAT
jgi:hypothetical protein